VVTSRSRYVRPVVILYSRSDCEEKGPRLEVVESDMAAAEGGGWRMECGGVRWRDGVGARRTGELCR
jgi:hypothetical protein